MIGSDLIIRVQNLGKRYALGTGGHGGMFRYKSLRDQFGNLVRRPGEALSGLLGNGPMDESNSFWALDDVSIDVRRGEVVGIIGRNGAGKSTLLKILSRITKPTTGRIDLYGRVGSLLEVGTGFHPELSGRENIYLNGAILGMSRAEVRKKFDEIVAFSEVERFLETPVKQYSSGMYMRLAFAVAAHLEPDVLVVDEVLAVGDADFQKKCLGKMKEVSTTGRTVLFVSHNMGSVRALCTTGCYLTAGRIRQFGPIESVIKQYMQAAQIVSEVDADEVADQRLAGPARILRCGVTQPQASDQQHFRPDLPIRVYADVQHEAGRLATFGIRVRTGMGQEILHVTSQDETDVLRLPHDVSRLTIDVPAVPFNDGDYFISFFLCDRSFQVQHQLIDAVSFTIDTSHVGHTYADAPLKVASKWNWTLPPQCA